MTGTLGIERGRRIESPLVEPSHGLLSVVVPAYDEEATVGVVIDCDEDFVGQVCQ
jgi:hypothetical protein